MKLAPSLANFAATGNPMSCISRVLIVLEIVGALSCSLPLRRVEGVTRPIGKREDASLRSRHEWDFSQGRDPGFIVSYHVFPLIELVLGPNRQEEAADPSFRLRQAEGLLSQGRTKEAEALVAEVISSNAKLGRAYELLGIILDAEQRYNAAEEAFRKAIDLAPIAAGPHVNLGISYVKRGQEERAIEEFQAALRMEPNNLAALTNLATFFLERKKYALAIKYFELALAVRADDPAVLLGLSSAYFAIGARNQALEVAAASSRIPSTESPFHFSLGLLLAKNAALEQAVAEFEEVAAQGVESHELYLNLGLAYSNLKRFDKAKEYYFKAIDLDPGDATPYLGVGVNYLALGKRPFALVWLSRAAKINPQNAATLYLYGTVLVDEKYYRTASVYLEQYTKMRPDDAKGWAVLGDAYLGDRQPQRALEPYEKALSLLPSVASSHYLVGSVYFMLHKFPEARRNMLEALTLDATYNQAHLKLGEIAYEEGRDEEALTQLRIVLDARPLHPEASYYLAQIYLRTGKIDEAENVLAKVEEKYPEDSRFHFLLARAYRKTRDSKNAERELALWNKCKLAEDVERRLRNPSVHIE